MADFTQVEKINIVMKLVFGIQGTSNTDDSLKLSWYEEQYPREVFIQNDEIFVETIPGAAALGDADTNATNYSFIEKREIKLTQVPLTNGRAWGAFSTYGNTSSSLYGDWFQPQIFGKGYAMRLFQDNGGGAIGTEITTTEGAWIPAYKLGFIVLGDGHTASDKGWTTPLWARVYRYIGDKGIAGSTAHVDLDNAYNESTSDDKSISVDDGALELNASNNYASLQITPIAYTPSANLAAGQVCIRGGILYAYNGTRTKWLSVDQPSISYQIRNGDANYLATGSFADIKSGYEALRDGTIVGITANGGNGNQTKSFAIRKNGAAADIATFSLVAGKYSSSATDLDFSAGDVLQIYCSATGTAIKNPRVNLLIAWRI